MSTDLSLPGRRIRLVAPARWVAPEVVEAFSLLMRGFGAEVVASPLVSEPHGQLAGDDEARAAALQEALADETADVVWAARGGWGSPRLLSRLDLASARARVFAGYSDHTALLQACYTSRVTPVHCAMPYDVRKTDGIANLATAARLIGAVLDLGGPPERSAGLLPVREGTATAPLMPANLSVLTRLLGTPWEPRWASCILALEDVDEYLYAIDRMVWHLAASRLGPRIKGIVVGDFTGVQDNEIPWGESVEEIVARNFPRIPIASGLHFGHGAVNSPLVTGEPAHLSVDGASAMLTLGGGSA